MFNFFGFPSSAGVVISSSSSSNKKSLMQWYNSGDITYSQKEIISKFGVGDYSYPLRDLKKLWYLDEIFERNKHKINIRGRIKKMIFFSTDWNNNLIIVVNDDNEVNLIVYEMPMQSGYTSTEILEKIEISKYGNMNEVYEAERKLKQSNPIFAFGDGYGIVSFSTGIGYDNDYNSSRFPIFFWPGGIVKRIELLSDAKSNPDKYIKPLDVVLSCNNNIGNNNNKRRIMVHSCVYLGDKKVCHVLGEGKGVVRIESWESFLDVIHSHKILRYHPVVAFKKPDEIIRHIAKSIERKSNYFSSKNTSGEFNIWKDSSGRSNNCENFANVCVFGINYSELADQKDDPEMMGRLCSFETSIRETSRILDGLSNKSSVDDRIREINRYKNSNHYSQGIKMETRIEVQPKEWYRLS